MLRRRVESAVRPGEAHRRRALSRDAGGGGCRRGRNEQRSSGGGGVGIGSGGGGLLEGGSGGGSGGCCIGGGALLQECPVKHEVELEVEGAKQDSEHVAQVAVVGRLLELEVAAVIEVLGELDGVAAAEHLDGRVELLLADLLVFLLLVRGLESLPRQLTPQKIHKHVAERLEVVTSALLNAHVRVDRRIARSARQMLVLAVRDVLPGARISAHMVRFG